MADELKCADCGKRRQDLNALYQHAKAKHGKKAAAKVRAIMPKPERSLGEELAEAAIAWRCEGIDPPGYLHAMFPDQFGERI